jgi:hypothetical protein
MSAEFLVIGLAWYVILLFSTTCHEAAHSSVAKLGGDLTAFHRGQASLDPIPHIRREPFGMVIFPILPYAIGGWTMGWASAPYEVIIRRPERDHDGPHQQYGERVALPGFRKGGS